MGLLNELGQRLGNDAVAAGVAGAVVGAGVGSAVTSFAKRKKNKSSSRKRKTANRKRRSSRVRRTPRTAGKGRDRSTRRIRYTKKGQPYVIKSNGRAMFIKKSSAKKSHKMKGGRY